MERNFASSSSFEPVVVCSVSPIPLQRRSCSIYMSLMVVVPRASTEKFPGGEQQKKTRPKNSTFKPPSTLSVPCMKFQGGTAPPCPRLPTTIGGATQTFSGDRVAEEHYGDSTVGPYPKVWIRDLVWKKWFRRWRT